MDLFNYKTGQWESHPEDDTINTKIASGEFGLPKGIDIPIVTPDGALATVAADKAAEAFREGYRWQFSTDRNVAEEKGKEQILEEQYGSDEAMAMALGAARSATFGLSDVGLRAAGLEDPTREIKERNPISSTVGEVAGVFTPMGAGAVAGKVGAKAALGTKALLSGRAANAVAKYGSAAVGSAIEGAAYGLGQGVSESALGDPSELVENIAAAGGQGLLFGGLLGGAFQGAKDVAPFISSMAKAGADKLSDAAGTTARAGYRTLGKAAVKMRKGEEAAELFGQAIDDVAGRSALDATGSKTFKDMAAEADVMGKSLKQVAKEKQVEANRLAKEIADEMGGREKQVRQILKNAPKEIQEQLAKDAEGLGYDLGAILNNATNQLDNATLKFESGLNANYKAIPAQKIDSIISSTEAAAQALRKSGSRTAQALGKNLSNMIESEVGNIRSVGGKLADNVDIPAEFGIAKRIQEQMAGYKLKPADAKVLESLSKTLDDSVLKTHYFEDIQKGLAGVNNANRVVDDMRGMLSTPNSPVKKLPAIMQDPVRYKALDSVLSRAEEFYPDIVRIRQGFRNAAEKQDFLKAVQGRIRSDVMGAANGKLSLNDTEDVLQLLGKNIQAEDLVRSAKSAKSKQSQIERMADDIQKIKATLNDVASAGVVDRYQAFARALGKDVGKDVQELQKLSGLQDKLKRLKELSPEDAPSLGRDLGRGALWFVNPKVAAAVKAAESVASVGSNPYRSVQTLTAIERFANSGAKAASEIINKTVQSLVSGKALKVARSGYLSGKSMKEQRKEYEVQKEILLNMVDPVKAAEYLETRIPLMEAAPGVQAAFGSHMINVSSFLASKLPEDTQGDTTVFMGLESYPPSDTEMAQFMRYANAAENPLQVVENIGALTATPEEIETMQVLYPSLYKRLQDQVLNDITNNGSKLTYGQRLMVGEVLNLTTDPSMRGDFVLEMQQNYAQQMPADQGGRPAGGGNAKVNIDIDPMETVATNTQRITST